MDINKLKHFRTVFESKSIRKAAEILGLSAGALSKSLRVFQEEIGIKLIEPHGRGIVVTKEGMNLYHQSSRVFSEIDFLKRSLSGDKNKNSVIGTYEIFSTHFLSQLIKKENLEYITCKELAPGEIEKALLDHKIDYGLTLIPFPHEDLDHLKIGQTTLKVFCGDSHKGKMLKSLEIPFAVPVTNLESNPLDAVAIDHWPINIKRDVQFHFQQLETALLLTSLNKCLIYAPQLVIDLFNKTKSPSMQLREHAFQKANRRLDIFIVKRKEFSEDVLIKKIAKFVRGQT